MKNPHTSAVPGFTTLFAVLVASLLLAVGMVIFDITFKEITFSIITRDSNFALYAADSGLECALYWDRKYSGTSNFKSGSVFATSTASQPPASGVLCDGQDLATSWALQETATAATTTFTVTFPPQAYCSVVTVAKTRPFNTSISARGYNTCVTGAPNRIERALQANY